MLLLISCITLTLGVIWYNRNEYLSRQFWLAIALMIGYLLLYLVIPPFPKWPLGRAGQLFELLPFAAFATLLFSSLDNDYRNKVVSLFAWLGLALITIILCLFKFWVW